MMVQLRKGWLGLGLASAVVLGLAANVATAYPGGTPDFQTDVAPFCAACHSSTAADALDGAGPRADKEVAAQKHIAPILAGEGNYEKLSPEDRKKLAEQIEALDANSRIEIVDYPPQVDVGATFNVTVLVTGGAGPVVGVSLVDRAHRWYARPASAAGWEIVGAPTIIGPNDRPQSDWIDGRPERFGRAITYVNITGVESDAVAGKWSKAKVIYTLRAPSRPGDYPLVGAYLYGTEKATKLGSTIHPVYQSKQPLGGYGGKSGRVKFTAPMVISVKGAEGAAK
jgi:hypothetical protein